MLLSLVFLLLQLLLSLLQLFLIVLDFLFHLNHIWFQLGNFSSQFLPLLFGSLSFPASRGRLLFGFLENLCVFLLLFKSLLEFRFEFL
mmetsp:Transcript_24722/g.70919  ORF Transcript_24722/g.70919 Transcript_24722/m.70919 type:complete len:88 (+) Transcript_24722:1768-2031(+)